MSTSRRSGLTVEHADESMSHEAVAEVFDLIGVPDDQIVTVRRVGAAELLTDRLPTEESYRIVRDDEGWTIDAVTLRGVRWAAHDIADRRCPDGVVTPGFNRRGVIEGFYGTPWTHDERLDMIRFVASRRMNTFMYAPKDDPFLRARWREPHEGEAAERLTAAMACAAEHGVDMIVGVSPGLSMRYSSTTDLAYLVDKIERLLDAGATTIAVLFDDIPPRLQHPVDVDRFASLAEAHRAVANAVARHVRARAGTTLICPTEYHGRGDEPYAIDLWRGLDPTIEVFWTGRAICSPEITTAEAVTFAHYAHRPPLYWDNYPVNDVAMTDEIHLAAFDRRDASLGDHCNGLLANAMEAAEASKISIATIADYLWDPHGYDPDASWQRAIALVAGGDRQDTAALARFCDAVRASCLSDPDPVELGEVLSHALFDVEYGDADLAVASVRSAAADIRRAADRLRSDDFGNTRLRGQIRPWVDKYALGADVVDAIATELVAPTDPAALAELLDRFVDDRHRVLGDVVPMTATDLLHRSHP